MILGIFRECLIKLFNSFLCSFIICFYFFSFRWTTHFLINFKHFYYFLCPVMSGRVIKKDPIHLKFDTSSDNLACFINKRSKLPYENDNNERQSKSTRRRPKSIKSKICVFKN